VVFDAPAVFKQLCSIDEGDPLDLNRFKLPIVNFVMEVNVVNCNSAVSPHLGQVLVIETFSILSKPGWCEWVKNTFSFHGVHNFNRIDVDKCEQVKHLPSRKTEKYNQREIQSFFFCPKHLKRLQIYLFLAPMCAALVDQLPTWSPLVRLTIPV